MVLVSLIILSISSAYLNVYIAALFHQVPTPPIQARTFFWIYFPAYALVLTLLLVSYYRAVFASPGYTDPLDVLPPQKRTASIPRSNSRSFGKMQSSKKRADS